MKKLLLAIYIIFVVTASLASRAETVPPIVKIQTAEFQFIEEAQVLRMIVQYPSPCIRGARPVLTPSEYEGVFYIEVAAPRNNFGCIQPSILQGSEIEVKDISLRDLQGQLRRFSLSVDGTYTLISRDGSFEQTIDFSKVSGEGFSKHPVITGNLLSEMAVR